LEDPFADDTDWVPSALLSARLEQAALLRLLVKKKTISVEEFLADLGVAAPARDRLIRGCYDRLKLVSFLTYNPTECRAWSIPAGTDAVTAAGEVHTDMARGFIRAEVVAFDDLQAAGEHKSARAAGKVRLEGKHYIVQDGDVILFRFNV